MPNLTSLSSLESMQTQTPSAGTSTRLPLPSTLIPATMQVGPNGERHLILHYPDGHSIGATALPHPSGQLHLVPMLNQSQVHPSTLRLVPTAPAGMHLEQSAYLVKNKSGHKVELVCTCPPELHQGRIPINYNLPMCFS